MPACQGRTLHAGEDGSPEDDDGEDEEAIEEYNLVALMSDVHVRLYFINELLVAPGLCPSELALHLPAAEHDDGEEGEGDASCGADDVHRYGRLACYREDVSSAGS